MISRFTFFDRYRSEFGKIINQKTVEAINAILERSEKEQTPISKLAYIFATSMHEARDVNSKADFYPIMERGGYNYITHQYWKNVKVRGWLGNRSIEDAWNLRGRGLVQITGYRNYKLFGIENNPDKALEINKAVEILFDGMKKGMFTGKKLSDYINSNQVDYVNARRIINGTDKAEHIASFAKRFEAILTT